LGHDLGHTPFGHAGEEALNSVCQEGFAHYKQSVRVVEVLEKKGEGLNLTKEVRDGILNHRTSGHPATLEGQVVRLSDKIAYINHDIDDAIRAGIMCENRLPRELTDILGHSVRDRLNTLVHDVILNSQDQPSICMSQEVETAMMELRRYMFQHLYLNPMPKGEDGKAQALLVALFHYYMERSDELPEEYRMLQTRRGDSKERVVCDYIAGMSDSYAIALYEQLFIPTSWK
jgi:dGTPase